MVDLNLPAPGQSPNWAPQLNNEIGKINAGLEGHESRVDHYGIPLTLEQFGGGGGEVSDSTALSRAVAQGGNKAIWLQAGKVYTLDAPVEIDVTKVHGVIGNGASVVVTGDFPAFHLVGNLTGSANPSQASGDDRRLRYAPFIQNVRISSSSTGTDYVFGTGILVERVFGARISDNFIRDIGTGVRFRGRNRNVRIQGNEIWNVRDYCLHFDAVNLHQMNITGNILGYAQRIIYFNDSDVYNVQIVSNDMQIASHPQGSKGIIHFIGGFSEDFSIVGNDCEDHQTGSEAMIIFDKVGTGQIPKHTNTRIVGNNISNYNNGGIRVRHPGGLIVSDNHFRGDGYAVLVHPDESGAHSVSVTGNQLIPGRLIGDTGNPRIPRGGLVRVRGSSTQHVFIEKLIISRNQGNFMLQTPIDVEFISVLHGEISDNSLDMGPDRGRPDSPSEALIQVTARNDSQYLRLMHISNNRLRARNIRGHLIRIRGFDSTMKTSLMCTENVGWEASGSTPFEWFTIGLDRDNLSV